MSQPKTITRQQKWELEYAGDRYMIGLSQAELDSRFADIVSNTTTLGDNGKLHFDTTGDWLEVFTHLMVEFNIRKLQFPEASSIKSELLIPSQSGLDLALRSKASFSNGLPDEFTLFKYGRKEFLLPLIEAGSLRLFPATTYNDPSLNPAIKDNELSFQKIVQFSRTIYSAKTNFLCFCSAWLPNNRLVADFEADCVLIIREPHEFFSRIMNGFDKFNKKNWIVNFNKVTYLDPLRLNSTQHISSLNHAKHMKYAYQFEHRLVLRPPTPTMAIEPIDVNVGSLRDIAELIV